MRATVIALALIVVLAAAAALIMPGNTMGKTDKTQKDTAMSATHDHTEVATLAGGCFWCLESDLEKLPGVVSAISGYSGGDELDPTYEQVSSGATGHIESVQVRYDPARLTYAQLLDWFWRHIDPTDNGGQFVDRGPQYRAVVFYHDDEQRRLAVESRNLLDASGRFAKPVVTEIRAFKSFYPAEDYHQDYYKEHSLRYRFYRSGSGRDKFLDSTWGDLKDKLPAAPAATPGKARNMTPDYSRPDEATLRSRLTPLQFDVTQHEGTEPPFKNEYWDNKAPGIYVDVVSGEPLFSSLDKYKSGTGWPSFTRPLEPANIVEREDRKLFSVRTEVRSRHADSHLGHVFGDGPQPTGLRYCINSAALRFVPLAELENQGYGQYRGLFE